jgi:hypothetical protein
VVGAAGGGIAAAETQPAAERRTDVAAPPTSACPAQQAVASRHCKIRSAIFIPLYFYFDF